MRWVDKSVAHLSEVPAESVPTFDELDAALDKISEIYRRWDFILTARDLAPPSLLCSTTGSPPFECLGSLTHRRRARRNREHCRSGPARLSEPCLRLQEHFHKLDFPERLWDQFDAGHLTVDDLRELLPPAWMYREGPEQVIGWSKWVAMFRTAGVLMVRPISRNPRYHSNSFGEPRPNDREEWRGICNASTPMTCDGVTNATGRSPLTSRVVPRDALLAMFLRPGDGPEVVLDPHCWVVIRQRHPTNEEPHMDETRAAPKVVIVGGSNNGLVAAALLAHSRDGRDRLGEDRGRSAAHPLRATHGVPISI